MRFQILIFCTILILTFFLTGCPSGQPTTNTPTNANQAIVNSPVNKGSDLTTTKTPTVATTNDAPTVAPVYKAYCDAMTKKDEAAIRKVYAQGTLKYFETEMKADNEKSLVKYLETDRVSNKLCEVRNEEVKGDVAVAEVKTEGAPNGYKVKFVKENGEWKLTNESPEFKAVEDASKNSNTAK